MEVGGDHEQRVVNYTDPELCDRPVKTRPPDYVRVPREDFEEDLEEDVD